MTRVNALALSLGALIGTAVMLILANTAWGSITPRQAATAFKQEYNAEHTPYVITYMVCTGSKVDPRAYFDCYLKIARRSGRSVPMCGVIVIDTAFDVLENHIVPCKTKHPLPTVSA